MTHSFIACKHFTEDLVIGLYMQQMYGIGCNWITEGKMYLHQGCPFNSFNVNTVKPKPLTSSTIQKPAQTIVTIPAKKRPSIPKQFCL